MKKKFLKYSSLELHRTKQKLLNDNLEVAVP